METQPAEGEDILENISFEKTTGARNWFGKILPRPEIVFVCQMVVIYSVIAVSLFNLTRGDADAPEGKVWIALMSSCLGYMLPNPKLHKQ